jgi:uncharacterized protein YacL
MSGVFTSPFPLFSCSPLHPPAPFPPGHPYTLTVSPPNPNLHPVEAAQRQKNLLLRAVRATFFILIVTFTTLAFLQHQDDPFRSGLAQQWWLPIFAAVVLFAVALAVDLITPNKKISTIIGVLVGVLAGLIATLALGFIIDLVVESWAVEPKAVAALKPGVNSIKVIIGITLSYLGVSTVLQTQDDFRLLIPYVEFAKQLRGTRPMLLDTSALIDGRIADVAATGFLQAPLVVPRFVIGELQTLSDSSEPMKRAKGRRGLEIMSKLQRQPKLDVSLDETPVPGKAVDQMLVELAREMPAVIVTADVALARVAAIQSVPVLNLNDLANAVKMTLVPGEPVTVKLMRQGEQAGQAVGYMPDGTMIVAEDGAGHIGQLVTMIVTSSLQTSAGRLIFARIGEEGADPEAAGAPAPSAHETVQAPTDAANGAASSTETPEHGSEGAGRSPFPPKPRPIRAGTPRNPRR